MLTLLNPQRTAGSEHKRSIFVTGVLADILTPGLPAVYLYQGNLIRTSTVEAILEAAPNHIRFETKTSIYTLSFYQQPDADAKQTA